MLPDADLSTDSSDADGTADATPQADSPWYAACESGHSFWAGPNRTEYDAAQDDARTYDGSRHGGAETAGVLGGP